MEQINTSATEVNGAAAKLRRPKRIGQAILAVFVVVALGFSASIAVAMQQYGNVFLPNTIIGEADVSGLTLASAKNAVSAAVMGTGVVTVQLAEQEIQLNKKQIGVSYSVDEVLRRAYTVGHSGALTNRIGDIVRSFFITRRIPVTTTVDDQKVLAWVDETLLPLVKDPVDATIGVKNNAVVINPSQDGLAIDLDKVTDDIVTAAYSNRPPVVTVEMTVVEPTVTDDSLKTYQVELEKLAHIPVSLTVNNQVVTPTFAQQITWFTVPKIKSGGDETDAITLNSAAVARTVNEIAKKTNQKMVKEQVNPEGAVLVAGKDGMTMDESLAVREIVTQFTAILQKPNELTGVAVAVAVPTTQVPKEQIVVTAPQLATVTDETVVPALDTDAKFIQLNLAKQRMYIFENHQLVNVFAISSGKAGYETPKGVHQIYNKALRPLSRRYGLYLPYWNAITADGAYGIHDLPEWPSGYKETAAHLGTPVSHGCIRINTEPAKWLYEWAPIGTAVVVQ